MKNTIEFDYSFGDTVKIIELNTIGIVVEINIGIRGIAYNVRYFIDGKAQYENFFKWELSNGTA